MKRYTKSIQVAMLAAVGVVLAAGCADSRVPSKQNLAEALNHDYSGERRLPVCQAHALSL